MMFFQTNEVVSRAQKAWKRALVVVRSAFKKRCDSQSICAKCARQILTILRQFHAHHVATSIYDVHHTIAKETREKIYNILNTLDPDGSDSTSLYSQLLVSHRCNRFACMILEEAITMYEEFNRNELDKLTLTSREKSVMASLEYILEDIQSDRYNMKTSSVEFDQKLDIFELKFRGHGIQYLKKLSEKRVY